MLLALAAVVATHASAVGGGASRFAGAGGCQPITAGGGALASAQQLLCAGAPDAPSPAVARKTDDDFGISVGSGTGDLLVHLRQERLAALKYAVQSRVYPEEPDRLFVTTRGAGLAVFIISDGARPALQAQWGTNHSLEGQDRVADTLVVVDLDLSALHVFTLSNGLHPGHALAPVGYLQFGLHGALHCRLYKQAPESGGGLFALVSIGHGIKTPCRLAVVNVTEPAAPRLVADFQTPVTCMEGVLVFREFAFVGGYCDSYSLVVISLEDIAAPRIVRALHNSSYVNMVGALGVSDTGAPLMYQALWTKPGGLAIFDLGSPSAPVEIGRVVGDNTSFANRVQLNTLGYAFLPLEAGLAASGIAAIDIRDPRRPFLAQAIPLPGVKVYCLATFGMFVYAFGIEGNGDTSMYQFRINPEVSSGVVVHATLG